MRASQIPNLSEVHLFSLRSIQSCCCRSADCRKGSISWTWRSPGRRDFATGPTQTGNYTQMKIQILISPMDNGARNQLSSTITSTKWKLRTHSSIEISRNWDRPTARNVLPSETSKKMYVAWLRWLTIWKQVWCRRRSRGTRWKPSWWRSSEWWILSLSSPKSSKINALCCCSTLITQSSGTNCDFILQNCQLIYSKSEKGIICLLLTYIFIAFIVIYVNFMGLIWICEGSCNVARNYIIANCG